MKTDKLDWQTKAMNFVKDYIEHRGGEDYWNIEENYATKGFKIFKKARGAWGNNMYFYFLLYRNSKSFGFALATDSSLGDEKFRDYPIWNYVGDGPDNDLTEEEKEVLIKRTEYVMQITNGLNDSLKKSINVLEEKFLVEKSFEPRE
jgi:hypothetical protein